MNEGPPTPKRVCLAKPDLEMMTKEDLLQRWIEQDLYIDALVSGQASGEGNRQQYEAARRENVLVMRLTTKEQEMQDIASQIEELKRTQNPNTAHLRTMLLDPAINLMFQRMKKEMDVCKEKLEQAQNDLAAWKFTPDGQTGKRLMAKCRMLLQENEEIGKVISAGRTAKLEGEIALEKKFVEEMKASQAETDGFLVEMDEDIEGLQSTVLVLQQQLKEAKEQITQLTQDNENLRKANQQTPAYNQTDSSSSLQGDSTLERTGNRTPVNSSSNIDSSNGSAVGDWTHIVSASQIQVEPIRVEPVEVVGNGQHHNDEAMDTADSNTGRQEKVANSHNTNNSHSPQNNTVTDGKNVVADSPLSPVRTSSLSKDNNVQLKTEGLTGAPNDEPIQNGLISSQYDSQDDER